jgi:hypothetical protein
MIVKFIKQALVAANCLLSLAPPSKRTQRRLESPLLSGSLSSSLLDFTVQLNISLFCCHIAFQNIALLLYS